MYCDVCGRKVMVHEALYRDGLIYCRDCFYKAYYVVKIYDREEFRRGLEEGCERGLREVVVARDEHELLEELAKRVKEGRL